MRFPEIQSNTIPIQAIVLGILAFALLMSSIASIKRVQASEHPSDPCDYIAETDVYLCFGFRAYWNDFGGQDVFGLPLTNEFQQDGRTVQYFENTRFEWHPGAWPERHDVLQGRLAAELYRDMLGEGPFAPAQEQTGCAFFGLTGHNVCGDISDFWNSSGGLAVFGYPLSEAHEFDGATVQYFERVRLEDRDGAISVTALGRIPVQIEEIRSVTEQFHDVEVAMAAGYHPIEINGELCVSHDHHGTMGIHYLKESLVGDDPLDYLQPQLLLYIPDGDDLRLTGVEYFTPDVGQPHPVIFERGMDGPIDTLEGIPAHYQLHAWVWSDNPAGVFAQFNPALTCPSD